MSFIDEVWLDRQTLEAFLASEDFAEAVVMSTKAGFGGSCYKVELFPDGHWRVLWANMIGNRYESPGWILTIPQLDVDDYADYVDMIGTDETEELAKALRGTETLEVLEQCMREEN